MRSYKSYRYISREDFETLLELYPPTWRRLPDYRSSKIEVQWAWTTEEGNRAAVTLIGRGIWDTGARSSRTSSTLKYYGRGGGQWNSVRFPSYIREGLQYKGKGSRDITFTEEGKLQNMGPQETFAREIVELLGLEWE